MAITAALTAWCERMDINDLVLHTPYANQQGSRRRQYCADIVGLLGSAAVILLEVKYLPEARTTLSAFNPDQHEACIRLEELDIPIAYAYNACYPLAYHAKPRPADWPKSTLCGIKRSPPRSLPSEQPSVDQHGTLYDWLQQAQGQDVSEALGSLHGAVETCIDLRNGVLVLLYSPDKKQLAAMEAEDVLALVKDIRDDSSLSSSKRSRIEQLLGASSAISEQISRDIADRDQPRHKM